MSAAKTRRDGLGRLCFWLHVVILMFAVSGWAVPARGALIAYLIFLPVMILHWKLNRGTCILNNIENRLRHGRWRAPDRNPEEGAWLRTVIGDITGIVLTRAQMDGVIYVALALFWALAWLHLLFWMPSLLESGYFQGA